MDKLGIYVHIPFCKKKCKYCDFISFSCDGEKIDEYFKCLEKEIEGFENKNREITTIYIGGGTPSFVDSNYIVNILKKINDKFNVSDNCEVTIEINPGTVNQNKLEDYKSSGINRVSIRASIL